MKPSAIAIAVTVGTIILCTILIVATLIYTNAHELKPKMPKTHHHQQHKAAEAEFAKGSSGQGSSTTLHPPPTKTTGGPSASGDLPPTQTYDAMVIKMDRSPEPSFYFKADTELRRVAIPIRQRSIRGYDCDCYRIPEALAFDAKQLPRRWDLFVIKPDPKDMRPSRKGQVKLCIPHHSARL